MACGAVDLTVGKNNAGGEEEAAHSGAAQACRVTLEKVVWPWKMTLMSLS